MRGDAEEAHLIQSWPAGADDATGARLIKVTDGCARLRSGSDTRLMPWELDGARAKHAFIAQAAPAGQPASELVTLTTSAEFPSCQVYDKTAYLPSLLGSGGSGRWAVGYEATCDVHDNRDYSVRLKLHTFWTSANPPVSASWSCDWWLEAGGKEPARVFGPRQDLQLLITADGLQSVVTFAHRGVSRQHSDTLTALWRH